MPKTPDLKDTVALVDYSVNVPATAVTAIPAETIGDNAKLLRVINNSGSGTLWMSQSGTASVGGLGCLSIGPGLKEVYATPGPIPNGAVSLISSTGTIAATVQLGLRQIE